LPTRRGLMDYWKAKKRSLEAGNNPGSKALAVPAPKMDHGDNQDNRDKRDNSDKKIAGRLGANHFIASNSGFLNSFEGVSQVPVIPPGGGVAAMPWWNTPGRRAGLRPCHPGPGLPPGLRFRLIDSPRPSPRCLA